MNICFFGDYNPDYVRTKVMLDGLSKRGFEVIQINERGSGKYWRLFKRYIFLRKTHDLVFVAYSDTRLLALLAKLVSRKPIIWDPLYSIYDNWVFDRKFVDKKSLKAKYYWILDWIGCKCSDLIVLDTMTNAEYFSKEFNVPIERFSRVLTGADPSVFVPQDVAQKEEKFEVEFHGKFIPVHGVDVIVRAAKILEQEQDIHFTIIGKGQTLRETQELAESFHLKNTTFVPFVPITELPKYVARASVTIGLLGDVPRIVRAIPGKMYEASASQRVTINADTPALREIYTNGVDCVAIKQGDPEALAAAILKLRSSPELCATLSKNALITYEKFATPERITDQLITAFDKLLSSP